jgi:dethiobiotin synthetase
MTHIAIAGIHTGIGKTIASAIICEALQADYWKPVQAGDLDKSDTITVRSLLINDRSHLHPEAYRLNVPASPHLAARLDGVEINLHKLTPPATDNTLIIETAGGLLSPLNENNTNLDFLSMHKLPVILVSGHYLGSINHTLLSCEALKHRGLHCLGILFVGDSAPTSEEYALNYTGFGSLGTIPQLTPLSSGSIAKESVRLRENFTSLL